RLLSMVRRPADARTRTSPRSIRWSVCNIARAQRRSGAGRSNHTTNGQMRTAGFSLFHEMRLDSHIEHVRCTYDGGFDARDEFQSLLAFAFDGRRRSRIRLYEPTDWPLRPMDWPVKAPHNERGLSVR